MDIVFHPIGTIRSPYKDRKDAPMWGADDPVTEAELILEEAYLEGAADMQPGKQYQLVFFFHKSDSRALTVARRGDGPLTGVFSTHSPTRPNPIGISIITVKAIDGSRIRFTGVDMLDGTPVLDIKSYRTD